MSNELRGFISYDYDPTTKKIIKKESGVASELSISGTMDWSLEDWIKAAEKIKNNEIFSIGSYECNEPEEMIVEDFHETLELKRSKYKL